MSNPLQTITDIVDGSKNIFTQLKNTLIAKEQEIASLLSKVADYESKLFNLTAEKTALEELVNSVTAKVAEMENLIKQDILKPLENGFKEVESVVAGAVDSGAHVVASTVDEAANTVATEANTVATEVANTVSEAANTVEQAANTVEEKVAITPLVQ